MSKLLKAAALAMVVSFLPSLGYPAQAQPCEAAFSIVDTPNPAGASNELHGVAAISKADVWAVGSRVGAIGGATKTLAEHWNGSSWKTVPTVDPDTTGDSLGAVDGLGPNDVWAVGQHGAFPHNEPLVEHWDGKSWTRVKASVPGSAGLSDVKEVSPTSIWAIGASLPSPTPVIERSKGAGFSQQSVGSFGNSASLIGVDGLSRTDVWAVGSYFDASNIGHPLALHWNGSTWSEVPALIPDGMSDATLRDVVEIASDDVWGAGFSVDPDGVDHTLVEHWTGSGWSVVASPSPVGRALLYGIAAINADHAYAVGVTGDINHPQPLAERWNGSSWSLVSMPSFAHPTKLFDVATTAAGYVWISGTTNRSAPKTVILQRCP